MSHPVVRWQIVSPDAAASARFYQHLFDWSCTQDNALGYREMRTGGDGPDGGVWPAPSDARPFVQLFVRVPDVAAHVERATALGAAVIVPPTALPDGETMAVLHDPLGMPFVLCRMREPA